MLKGYKQTHYVRIKHKQDISNKGIENHNTFELDTKMPLGIVIRCGVSDCTYNIDNYCRRPEISIDDKKSPLCGNYCRAAQKVSTDTALTIVSQCDVVQCRHHNKKIGCQSPVITVGYDLQVPKCLTYLARQCPHEDGP